MIGYSLKPNQLFVVGCPWFRFCNLNAFTGLELSAAMASDPPQSDGLLIELMQLLLGETCKEVREAA